MSQHLARVAHRKVWHLVFLPGNDFGSHMLILCDLDGLRHGQALAQSLRFWEGSRSTRCDHEKTCSNRNASLVCFMFFPSCAKQLSHTGRPFLIFWGAAVLRVFQNGTGAFLLNCSAGNFQDGIGLPSDQPNKDWPRA